MPNRNARARSDDRALEWRAVLAADGRFAQRLPRPPWQRQGGTDPGREPTASGHARPGGPQRDCPTFVAGPHREEVFAGPNRATRERHERQDWQIIQSDFRHRTEGSQLVESARGNRQVSA